MYETGTFGALGPSTVFYNGDNAFGVLITPSGTYSYGAGVSNSFTGINRIITSTDITNYTATGAPGASGADGTVV